MKKTLKAILGMTIALIMVFGSIPAFAAQIGDTVLWVDTYEDEVYSYEHLYGGKLTEGHNELEACTEDGDYYFEFDAPETGYYYISTEVYFGDFGRDGNIYDVERPDGWLYTEEDHLRIVYLEKGTVILGAYIWENEFDSIEIEYIDDEIVDVEYDESLVNNLIINSDMYLNSDGFYYYVDEYTVEFSNGETVEAVDSSLEFKIESKPVNGENTVYMTFANYEEEKKVNLYYIDSLVESIELSNVEDYLTGYEYYDGSYYFHDYNGEEITVNYTDGTSETFVYGWNEDEGQKSCINLFGNEHYIGIYHDEENLTLVAFIADCTFASYECDSVEIDSQSNYEHLKESVSRTFENFLCDAEYYWNEMWNPENIEYFFHNARYFIETFRFLSNITNNIGMYLRFVF